MKLKILPVADTALSIDLTELVKQQRILQRLIHNPTQILSGSDIQQLEGLEHFISELVFQLKKT